MNNLYQNIKRDLNNSWNMKLQTLLLGGYMETLIAYAISKWPNTTADDKQNMREPYF